MNRSVAIALLGAALLVAQTNRGGISGTVKDATGAVIPGASVLITNAGTNETRRVTTSGNGTFLVQDLEPVVYSLQVEMQGFKKYRVDNIKVDTASIASVSITLDPGAVETQVTVSAEAVSVNTDSGMTGSTVTEREIRDLPLFNRSVLDLALAQANVSGNAGTEDPAITATTTCPGCNISINGGRPLNSLIMADGTNNTGVSLARTMVSFTPETVQEFTIQTTAYSAEYSNTGGGVINVTTKSGSNQFRGTALWYNRNPAFAAAPFTIASTNRPVPTLKYNQFSISAGGPVWIPKVYNGKNRTFWFGAVEPQYRRDHLDQYGLIPTPAMQTGDFNGLVNTSSGLLPAAVAQQFKQALNGDPTIYQNYGLNGNQFTLLPAPASGQTYAPFPDNMIPKSMIDATAVKALAYVVKPGDYYLNANGTVSNIFTPRVLQQDERRYTLRIDQMISERNRVYGRYSATPIVKTQFTPISPTTDTAEYSYARQAMLANTYTFSPTLLNDVRLSYTRGRFSNTVAPEFDATTGQNLNTLLGLPNITKGGVPGLNGLFPGSSLGGGGSTATGLGSGGSTELEDREDRYAINDTVYKTHGSMNWKFGGEYSKSLQNAVPLFAAVGGIYSFAATETNSTGTATGTGGNAFASFLLGVPHQATLRSTEIPYYYRWKAAGAFVQNDWKVRPNLTLNLGLRYNLQLPRIEKYNNQGVFRPDLAQSVPLASPLTLADGEVISSALVPPFAFSGRGNNSPYLTPPDYTNFEPRFGFAWSPAWLQSHRVTLRGGYGLSHAPVTGSFRIPQPDFGATANFAIQTPSTTVNPNYVMRLGENPPQIVSQTPAQAIGAPANGLVYGNSLYYQSGVGAFAVSPNYHTPYVQNWNLTVSWQASRTTTVEFSYVGAKGTHLFAPHENINGKNVDYLNALNNANISTTGTINDPLGRLNPATGRVLPVQNGSLGSKYLGFSTLYMLFDASSNSIRHGGYVTVIHRVARGLTFTANYTYAKSIDDASSAGGDKNVLAAVNGFTDGQVSLGGTRSADRSVSTFDIRQVINGTYIYDLPFGRGRALASHLWKPLDLFVSGWTTSGLIRFNSGFPAMVTMADANLLGDLTHTARPDLVPGVPLKNPLYNFDTCPVTTACQPYLNPAAFERPVIGQLGSAPRTLDGARGPWDRFFDASIQKNFRIGEKRSLQFRVDLLNAFNHPVFNVFPNNAGGTDLFTGAPSTGTLTASNYNVWAAANGQPSANTAAGTALYNQIVANVNAQRTNGALPLDFYHVTLPGNFWGTPASAFDIRTLQGYKLYQLRQVLNTTGQAFGQLYASGQPRFIQFGVKFYF